MLFQCLKEYFYAVPSTTSSGICPPVNPTASNLHMAFTYFQLHAISMFYVGWGEKKGAFSLILLMWEVKSLTQCIWWWNLISKISLLMPFSLETDASHVFMAVWWIELKEPYAWERKLTLAHRTPCLIAASYSVSGWLSGTLGGRRWPHPPPTSHWGLAAHGMMEEWELLQGQSEGEAENLI